MNRTCITCHAQRLGEPVTAEDCLGFVACETCTKLDFLSSDKKSAEPRTSQPETVGTTTERAEK